MIWDTVSDYGKIFDVTENYVPFGDGAPKALQKFDEFFDVLKKSHSHKKMGELASKLSGPHDVNLRIRFDPTKPDFDNYPWVVAASLVKASDFPGEFGENFELGSLYESRNDYDGSENKAIKMLDRAISMKYDRHIRNTDGHIAATLSLFEPVLVYATYLKFMESQKSRGIEFSRPEFSNEGRILDAKHPLITTEPVRGNDITYGKGDASRLLTGPNNGGKTVYVKTVGLVHALAQRGFYVPSPEAQVRFVDQILTHFVSPDDISHGEGRYKNEMRRMDEIFNTVTPESLVILDEPCGGTTLEAGEKITQTFLKGFSMMGAPTYLTTHMSGLADSVNSGGSF